MRRQALSAWRFRHTGATVRILSQNAIRSLAAYASNNCRTQTIVAEWGSVYAYNDQLSGNRRIGATALTLIKISEKRLGDTEECQTNEGVTAVYSSRARTLVDAVYDWSRFDSLPRAYDWIRRELSASRVSASALVSATIRYGNQGTIRRIGALLEREEISGKWLTQLRRSLKPSSSLIPWVPAKPKRGKADQQWGVVFNG